MPSRHRHAAPRQPRRAASRTVRISAAAAEPAWPRRRRAQRLRPATRRDPPTTFSARRSGARDDLGPEREACPAAATSRLCIHSPPRAFPQKLRARPRSASARASRSNRWQKYQPGASDKLVAFTRLPPSQWKSARTTNTIERLHEEFKRRIKTQTVLPCAETAAMLFWALLASGQIRMRKIDGWQSLARPVTDQPVALAA
jgi:hypothetical protein